MKVINNVELFEENYFYSKNGLPTEIYKYNRYLLFNRLQGELNDVTCHYFALIENARCYYIRLCSEIENKNGEVHGIPCGGMSYPPEGGWFTTLSQEDKNRYCPIVARGISAFLLSEITRGKDGELYRHSKKSMFSRYKQRQFDIFMNETRHRDPFNDMEDGDLENVFLNEHLKEEEMLSVNITRFDTKLHDYVCSLKSDYLRWLNEMLADCKHELCSTFPEVLDTDGAIKHFNAPHAKEQLICLFDRLKENGYLHRESDLDTWQYVCGIQNNEKQMKLLKWTKDQELLACLVNNLFGDSDGQRLWVITENVFTVRGKAPNTRTMKNVISRLKNGWKDKPPKFYELEKLLIL